MKNTGMATCWYLRGRWMGCFVCEQLKEGVSLRYHTRGGELRIIYCTE
jgi:hypothetical protein